MGLFGSVARVKVMLTTVHFFYDKRAWYLEIYFRGFHICEPLMMRGDNEIKTYEKIKCMHKGIR